MRALRALNSAKVMSKRWQNAIALVVSFTLFALAADTGPHADERLRSLPFVLLGVAIPIIAAAVADSIGRWLKFDFGDRLKGPIWQACRNWCIVLTLFLAVRHVQEFSFLENVFFATRMPSWLSALAFVMTLSAIAGVLLVIVRFLKSHQPLFQTSEVLLFSLLASAMALTLY